MAIGGFLGGKIGHLASKIVGFGDYRVNQNSLFTGGMNPPQIVNSVNTGGVIVRHREYITDINATIAFTLQSFPLNPGLNSTFPWLASVAGAYEEYRWRGVIFEFKSMSSDAVLSSATSSALGTVMMATEYNVNNPLFTSKLQMENYEFANSDKPSCSFIHPIECARNQTPVSELFVRGGAAIGDLRLYDLGNFQIATQGMQAASGVCGELWCTYEVEFFKPRFNPITDGGILGIFDHFRLASPSAAAPLGTGSVNDANATIGGTVTPTVYTFPSNITEGNFLFTWYVEGSTPGVITSPSITISGGSLATVFANNSSNRPISPNNGVTSPIIMFQMLVVPAISGCTVTWGTGGVFPTTGTNGDLFVVAQQN